MRSRRARSALRVKGTLLVLAASAFLAAPASAQTPAPEPSSAPAREDTRLPVAPDLPRIYAEAVAAFQNGDYAAAYDGFLRVWNVEKKPKTAGNLGRTEVHLGKYRDAAEHLALFLREHSALPPAVQKEIEALLARAKARIGTLRITLDRRGARLTIDGAPVGTAALEQEIYVEPGRRRIEAHAGLLEAAREIDAAAGTTSTVDLALAPAAVPPARPFPTRQMTALFSGVGAMTTGGMLLGAALLEQAQARSAVSRNWKCARESGPVEGAHCDAVRAAAGRADAFWNTGIGMLTTGAAAAAGAATLLLLDASKTGPARSSRLVPVVGPGSAGVVWSGSF
jgi:hypothetical protein